MLIKSSGQLPGVTLLKRFPVPRNFGVTPSSRIERGKAWPAPAENMIRVEKIMPVAGERLVTVRDSNLLPLRADSGSDREDRILTKAGPTGHGCQVRATKSCAPIPCKMRKVAEISPAFSTA